MKLENLAPAGNREALDRAAAAGADAVYLGYAAFSARAGAGNFDEEQLREAVHFDFVNHTSYVRRDVHSNRYLLYQSGFSVFGDEKGSCIT